MAIIRPENMDFSCQTFSAIIYGSPGIGKTTLACSAPDPVLIDFDHGVSRIRAQHRVPTIFCETFEEVQKDVNSPAMMEFKTVIIDTGGSFVSYLKDWAFRTKSDAKTKTGQFHSLKGFGYVKSEFASFTSYIKTVLNKNVIYVFHAEEKADKDGNPVQRLLCEGSVRNTVWNSCDFGGYVQMLGNQRTICFTPEQEFFAKGTHGITGRISLPELGLDTPNDFMTRLFQQATASIKAEADAFGPVKERYEKIMEEVREILAHIIDADSATVALKTLREMDHALTSKRESSALLATKARELGLVLKDGEYAPIEG